MYKRLTVILLLLVLSLFAAALTSADATDEAMHCADLSAADCQIVLDNLAKTEELYSFAMSMNMEFDVAGADPAAAMNLVGASGGAFSIDPDIADQLNAMTDMPAQDELTSILATAISNLTGDLWLDLDITAEGESESMSLQLRMKDGVWLLNAAALEAMTEQSMTGMEWFGLDMTGAADELLAELGLDLGSDEPKATSPEMEAAEAAAMTKVRLSDSTVNGVAVAVFETSVDLEAIMALITLEDLVALADPGEDAEMAMDIMENMSIHELYMREHIGLEDHYTYRLEIVADLSIAGEGLGDSSGGMSMRMDIDVEMSDFNQPVDVEIPEDAIVFPLAMMLQMGN